MATTLAIRTAPNQTSGLWRFSFNFLRNLSTTTSTQNPDACSSASKKPKRKKKKNLFEVAQFLPNWGLGYHMAKTHWTDVSYQITKINLYKVFSFSISQSKKTERKGFFFGLDFLSLVFWILLYRKK
ncbi:hypothetical protein CRYUN_Cryun02cG0183100 [Craigia yunnanensis]